MCPHCQKLMVSHLVRCVSVDGQSSAMEVGWLCPETVEERQPEWVDVEVRKAFNIQVDRLRKALERVLDGCFCNGVNNELPDCSRCVEVRKELELVEENNKRVTLANVAAHVCISFYEFTKNMQRMKECTSCGRQTSL